MVGRTQSKDASPESFIAGSHPAGSSPDSERWVLGAYTDVGLWPGLPVQCARRERPLAGAAIRTKDGGVESHAAAVETVRLAGRRVAPLRADHELGAEGS